MPSTTWSERVAPDEEARFAAFAESFASLQRRMSERYGAGRALHRKGLLALRGRLERAPDLPEELRQGLFSKAGPWDVHVRLSNGASRVQKDATPDIRGFALSVRGLDGPGALGGPTTAQDFLLIPREVFGMDVGPFVELALAAPEGPFAVLKALVRTHGLWRGFQEVRRLQASLATPFSGFLTEAFFSAAPIAWGPYAARVRLQPDPAAARPAAERGDDLAAEVLTRLQRAPSVHALQVQLYEDEATTPIEDPRVNWTSPYVTVGTLTLPVQGPDEAFAAEVERDGFDPWRALAEHRPLGQIMRARKHAYHASTRGRAGSRPPVGS